MCSESGRRDVVRLLMSYEPREARRAETEERAVIDYGFLWKRLGMSRNEESS